MYKPLRFFFYIGTFLILIGLVPVVRFLYFYSAGAGGGHIQSLLLGGVFLLMGFGTYIVALLADLINFNRQLMEMTLERVKRMEIESSKDNEQDH